MYREVFTIGSARLAPLIIIFHRLLRARASDAGVSDGSDRYK